MKPAAMRMLNSQMLRPERLDVDVRRGYVEVVPGDPVEEEDQVQNDDVEVVVDEVREVDLLLPKMSKTKTMQMSRSKVEAKRCHQVGKDLVDEGCVEEVDRKMVMLMCRCGGVVLVGRGAGTVALLPC